MRGANPAGSTNLKVFGEQPKWNGGQISMAARLAMVVVTYGLP